jgi:RNA polymerase sigma-70 factor (ECF subfamily)
MEQEFRKNTFDTFFKKEYSKLVNYVRKNMNERFFSASPEDIVQDVALSLISKLDVNAQIENIAGYMYRSVKNRIIDSGRKEQRNVSIENFNDKKNGNVISNFAADEHNQSISEITDLDLEILHEAISKLQPDEKALIMATEFEGKTFESLSKDWNIPIGTLLSRKHRTLSKLHKLITQINLNYNYGNN